MSVSQFMRRMVPVASSSLIPWLPVLSSQVGDQPLGGPVHSAVAEGLGIVASDAVEDTLPACLAKIPKGASAGQRMIAAQGCERDERARQAIQAVPGQ